MDDCVFADRGYRCVWYQCADCGWVSHSADEGWSRRAGEVHGDILRPGHQVHRRSEPHKV